MDRSLRLLAWINLFVCLGLFAAAAALYAANQPAPEWRRVYDLEIWSLTAWILLFPMVALLIIVGQPRNTLGWLLSGIGIVIALNIFATQFAIFGLYTQLLQTSLPSVALWLRGWLWLPAIALLGNFLLLFPTGKLLSRRWRIVAWSLILIPVVTGVLALFGSAQLPTTFDPLPQTPLAEQTANLLLALFLIAFVASILSLLFRWRGENELVRQQIKWVIFASLMLGIIFFFSDFIIELLWRDPIVRIIASRVAASLAVAGLAASILIAILRYRLFDIDIIIRKTTSYAIISGLLALVYFGSIIVLQRLLAPVTGDSDLAVVLSTLLIAALFLPLRRRVQDAIDRRFFRRKYDAEKVLQQFAATARDETDLDALTAELLRVIQETMEPESVSLWLRPVAGGQPPTVVGGRPTLP